MPGYRDAKFPKTSGPKVSDPKLKCDGLLENLLKSTIPPNTRTETMAFPFTVVADMPEKIDHVAKIKLMFIKSIPRSLTAVPEILRIFPVERSQSTQTMKIPAPTTKFVVTSKPEKIPASTACLEAP